MRRGSIGSTFGKSTHLLDATKLIAIASNKIKQEKRSKCYRKVNIFTSFCNNDVDVTEMEEQCIDDLLALLCICKLLGNAHNVEEN